MRHGQNPWENRGKIMGNMDINGIMILGNAVETPSFLAKVVKFRLPYLITNILYLKQEWEWERSLENDFAMSTSMAVSKRLPGFAPLSAKLCRNRPCVDQKVSHRAPR